MGRVKLISGQFGGRFITSPDSRSTHPMGERVRSAIFNMLSSEVPGSRVLDAFAGSGAVGLEALSRGAEHVTFVEKDRVAGNIIAENIDLLGVEDRAKLIRASVGGWINTSGDQEFDLIFVDPPYHNEQFSTVERLLGLLKVGGCMILSHSGRGGILEKHGIVVVDNRSYGNANITLYRREDLRST